MNQFVVHCKKEHYDIYIGRPGKWGNPFILKNENDREKILVQYFEWINKPEQTQLRTDAKEELKGKILGCWCSPKSCHGNILIDIINEDN